MTHAATHGYCTWQVLLCIGFEGTAAYNWAYTTEWANCGVAPDLMSFTVVGYAIAWRSTAFPICSTVLANSLKL